MAIADHPWTKATPDAAAVRIAMTVAGRVAEEGRVHEIVAESGLDSDTPSLSFVDRSGTIHADLTIGADLTRARPLRANGGLAYNGMMLAARGFLLSAAEAVHLRSALGDPAGAIVRPYRNGGSLLQRRAEMFVIDTDEVSVDDLRRGYPAAYQHLAMTVKAERAERRDPGFRERWWRFGRPRPELRAAIAGLPRYIATTETAKHRLFQFLPGDVLPDHMVIAIGLADACSLGVLCSRIHGLWAGAAGGTLEDRPRYTKSLCFDPFPFPETDAAARAAIGDPAEELDAMRRAVLEAQPDLTMTGLYNLRDRVRRGETLDVAAQDQRRRGQVDILIDLHDRIDAAVADAYGWGAEARAGTLGDGLILERLVALNAARHRAEQAGTVQWLRPGYQLARAGIAQLPGVDTPAQIAAALPAGRAARPVFPRDAIGQTAAVLAALRGGVALSGTDMARRFAQGLKVEKRIAATLSALERLGHVAADGGRYYLRRAA